MGNACNCDLQERNFDEIVSSRVVRYQHAIIVNAGEVEETSVTIQFAPLMDTDPKLALSLNWQSIARGFLIRKVWIEQGHDKEGTKVTKDATVNNAEYENDGETQGVDDLGDEIEDQITFHTKLDLLSFSGETLKKIKRVLRHSKFYKSSAGKCYQGPLDSKQKKSGFGIEVDEQGNTYVGDFREDKKNGYGWLMFKNKNCYSGHFLDDEMTGKGRFYYKEGRTLTGNFISGVLNGEGSEVWNNGSEYKGNFLNSKKHGTGTLIIPQIGTYTGDFYKEKYHGNGTLVLDNGCSYNGHWIKGMKHGEGKFTWPNGKEYQGEYFEDKKHGKGRMRYPNKTIYNGDWVDDLQHGKAIFTYFDKSKNRLRSHNSLWEFGNKIAFLSKEGELIKAS